MKRWNAAPFEGRRAGDMPDLEIQRAAKQVLDIHGDTQAWVVAASRAIELHRTGDTEGYEIWRRIAHTLANWTLVDPPTTEKGLS